MTQKPLTGLKLEAENLHNALGRTWIYLADIEAEFWRNGGICCAGCGVPGFTELERKQERRMKRLEEIEAKIAKHQGK